MTRLRARGGIRDRPPIIDDDDEEVFNPVPTSAKKRRAGAGRKPIIEKIVERIGEYENVIRIEWKILNLFFLFRETSH